MTGSGLQLSAEYRRDSSWVATPRPRLSWVFTQAPPGWSQAAAELRLNDDRMEQINGPLNVFVGWPFEDLVARETYQVQVRLQGTDGIWTAWSDPLDIRLGTLGPGEWQARFSALTAPRQEAQPFIIRHRFLLDRKPARATLYWSALGAVKARIDGVEVDDSVLAPGWTSYADRVLHETTDVTALLEPGWRTIGLEVTGGWYTEVYGFADEARRVYGEQPCAAAQLHLLFDDGSEEIIASGDDWETTEGGEVVASGIYEGETIDHRRSLRWWDPQEGDWEAAAVAPDQPVPVARMNEPVRRVDTLAPVKVSSSAAGTILDFGQNLVGRLRIEVQGEPGTRIEIRHAEVLEDGELATRPLRRAAATDTFILSGTGTEVFEPVGTFHGFRYAEISGYPGEVDPERVQAIVLQSDLRRTGWLETSNPLLNQLHENIVWSMRGNFLSLPTDCPQRDERLGWTGDVQIFAPTAATLFDCNGFLANWLVDLRAEQDRAGGVVPNIVPNVFGFAWPAAAWGDAATVIPTVLAERFADDDLLTKSLDSMKAWVSSELAAAGGPGLWETTLQFGDWLDPDAPADMAGAAKTQPGLVATAYLYRSLDLLSKAAAHLGEDESAARARESADDVRAAFAAAYLTSEGRLVSDAPTAYALALQFGLIQGLSTREALARRLAHVIKRDAYHISTGFIGTPLVLDALTDFGYDSHAAALLLQTRCPSWLYPVTMGATTVWERWDSMLPDGSVNPGEMTSFNHYALGAVADWMYRRLAGIAPAAPGYSLIRFAPIALPGLDHATATVDTPAGRVEGGWRREKGAILWKLTVPAHATAAVRLPGLELEVGPGVHEWTTTEPTRTTAASVHMWSPVSEVVDNPEAFATVMEVLASHDGHLAEMVRRRTDWTLSTPLQIALFSVPPHVINQIAKELDA